MKHTDSDLSTILEDITKRSQPAPVKATAAADLNVEADLRSARAHSPEAFLKAAEEHGVLAPPAFRLGVVAAGQARVNAFMELPAIQRAQLIGAVSDATPTLKDGEYVWINTHTWEVTVRAPDADARDEVAVTKSCETFLDTKSAIVSALRRVSVAMN